VVEGAAGDPLPTLLGTWPAFTNPPLDMERSMRTPMYLLTLAVLLAFCVETASANDTIPDLTGNWVLNEKDSDAFKAPSRSQGGSPSKGGGGRGGGSRGGGGRGGSGDRGQGGGQEPSAEDQARMEERKIALGQLVIFQQDLEMNVTDGLDISRMLITDGRDLEIWTQQGMASATASWSGPTLVVRWAVGEEGPEQVRRYSLEEDGQKLSVRAAMQRPGSDKTQTMSLVYDRSE
jgi:hypothetical protein